MNLDKIDIQILEKLQDDAMITAKELAFDMSLTATPIYERIKKLKRSGIIKNYVALIDANLLGKNIVVFINITIKNHQSENRAKFVNQMESLDSIVELYHTSGSFDFLAKVRFSTIEHFRNFLVNELSSIHNINDIESQIVLEEIKYSTKVNLD
jgi:Lrp/AsnC family leucine-responsive transcriptional regulator